MNRTAQSIAAQRMRPRVGYCAERGCWFYRTSLQTGLAGSLGEAIQRGIWALIRQHGSLAGWGTKD